MTNYEAIQHRVNLEIARGVKVHIWISTVVTLVAVGIMLKRP